MVNYLDLNKYIELYQDFLHPNPNINSQAFLILKKEFEFLFKTLKIGYLETKAKYLSANPEDKIGEIHEIRQEILRLKNAQVE